MDKDYLRSPSALKIDLMLRGVRIEDPLIKAWACGASGIDIMLPRETLVNIPCSEDFAGRSRYVLKRSGDGHVISDGRGSVPVSLVPRPAFYDRKTRTGVPFSEIGVSHGSYTLITPLRVCGFFASSVECRYCSSGLDRAARRAGAYTVDEVVETVEAVLEGGVSRIIYLSIGFSEGPDGGIEFLKPYMEAIKRRFNCLVAVETLPPRDDRWIDETYAAGADSVLYNIEIFDQELFELICPGRARLIGRKRYMDALARAARIFPSGTVASHLMVGLEPPGSTRMGIDFLASMGVVPILPIYRPSPGGALRIEPLTTEIIIPVYKHLYRALRKNGINLNWVRDISMATTPAEVRSLVDDDGGASIVDNLYRSRIGYRTAVGLSTLRRKLRVKNVKDPNEPHSK
jgi:hypothetical protein